MKPLFASKKTQRYKVKRWIHRSSHHCTFYTSAELSKVETLFYGIFRTSRGRISYLISTVLILLSCIIGENFEVRSSKFKSAPPHFNENPIYVFLFWKMRGLIPSFHMHVSVRVSRIGPHIFCSIIGRSIVGIYESLSETWTWKFGSRLRNCFSGNIGFEFSVLCLCSAEVFLVRVIKK